MNEEILLYMHVDKPWLLVGGFNEITNQNEKLGGHSICRSRVDSYANTMTACN